MKRYRAIIIVVALVVIVSLLLVFNDIWNIKFLKVDDIIVVKWEDLFPKESDISEELSQEYETSEIEETVLTEETNDSEETEINYQAPEYQFNTEELVIEISGITDEYKIAWVSDLHMVTDSEPAEDIMEEDLEQIKIRYEMFKTEDGVYSRDLLDDVVDFLNYEKFDGIIFGGDMLDYCSKSNMDLLKEEFERLNKKVPVLYIRADHDYGFWYGGDAFTETAAETMHMQLNDGDDLNSKYLDYGEFVIIGINRSTKDMFPNQYAIVEEMINKAESDGKPVIIATHVPYESKVDDENKISLYDRSMEIRNKVYYWGGGNYIPNDVTSAYFENIYKEDTNVVEVLAGHLHAGWDGKLTEQVRQHIFEPVYSGSIGIIKVVPKGD